MPLLSLHPALEASATVVIRSGGHFHLAARVAIPAGTRILRLEGDLHPEPSRYSVQVDPHQHLEPPRDLGLEAVLDHYRWRCLNHSCRPNAFIRGRDLVALRRIPAFHEITFDYDATEYDMAEPFPCRCGAPRCRGLIRGYRHLDAAQRRRLRPILADHLRRPADPGVEGEGLAC